MTPDTTAEAIRALAQAVGELTKALASEKAAPIHLWTLAGVLSGVALAELLAWWREVRRRGHEKRLLAGTLAAELRGVKGVLGFEELEAHSLFYFPVSQSYTAAFDGAGRALFLLGPGLAGEVTACYMKVKKALDHVRRAQAVADQEHATSLSSPKPSDKLEQLRSAKAGLDRLGRRFEETSDLRKAAVEAVEEVLPKLDAVADPKQAKGQPT